MSSIAAAPREFSRRLFLGAIAGMMGRVGRGTERLDWCPDRTPRLSLERRYRADARILLLGVPVLHREQVGGGSVLWSEFDADGSTRLLEFNGYSLPERAAGLNRVGFIREMSRKRPGPGGECIYFGVMTASPEESADEARKALHSNEKEQIYTAIDGRIGGGETETTTARFHAPATMSGQQSGELMERARRALEQAPRIGARPQAAECCQSFLQTLAALLPGTGTVEGRYVYSGHPYRMKLTRSADAKATAYFRERRVIGESKGVTRVSGIVWRESGGKESEFRLWIPAGEEKPLPLRIEYQPKRYLQLTFEVVA
jgi:hypothetical protein